jgi:hypothetical protein
VQNEIKPFHPSFYKSLWIFESVIHDGKKYQRVNFGEKATSYVLTERLSDTLYRVLLWKRVEKGFFPWEEYPPIKESAYFKDSGSSIYRTIEDAENEVKRRTSLNIE